MPLNHEKLNKKRRTQGNIDNSVQKWETDKPSYKQLNLLSQFGITTPPDTKEEARKLIKKLIDDSKNFKAYKEREEKR